MDENKVSRRYEPCSYGVKSRIPSFEEDAEPVSEVKIQGGLAKGYLEEKISALETIQESCRALKRKIFDHFRSANTVNEGPVLVAISLHYDLSHEHNKVCSLAREILEVLHSAGRMTAATYREECSAVEAQRSGIHHYQITLLRKKRRISNAVVQAVAGGMDWDEAFITSVMGLRSKPAGAMRRKEEKVHPKKVHEGWKKRVLQFYDAVVSENGPGVDPNRADRFWWCPVTHDWQWSGCMSVIHIIPCSIKSFNVGYVLGEVGDGEDLIWDEGNAIPVYEPVEKCLEDGRIAIVPVDNTVSSVDLELKVVVLDNDMFERHTFLEYSWRDIHNRKLVFRNSFRPKLQFLYFRFVMTIIRRQRAAALGWWGDQKKDGLPLSSIWATPAPYLRRSLLRKLGSLVGIELPEGGTFEEANSQAEELEETTRALEMLEESSVGCLYSKEYDPYDEFDDDSSSEDSDD